jgi:RNA polymerase sigma-70 factor (ECF subfamily)
MSGNPAAYLPLMSGRHTMMAAEDDRRPRPELRLVAESRYPDWEAMYDDNVTWVYRMFFGRVGNRADAEDLTSEVFLAAMRPLRLTASIAEVRAYLRATARTVLAAHWRATLGTEITTIEDVPATILGPAAPSTAPQRVAALLDALPDNYRRVLELRFLQGCSVREAASALSVSVANAKVLQHRALRLAAQISEGVLS